MVSANAHNRRCATILTGRTDVPTAARYKAVLDSAAVQFRMLDRGDPRPDPNHCLHAITMTDDALHAEVDPIRCYGEPITRKLAEAMVRARVVADPNTVHGWLLPVLGLDSERDHLERQAVGMPMCRLGR